MHNRQDATPMGCVEHRSAWASKHIGIQMSEELCVQGEHGCAGGTWLYRLCINYMHMCTLTHSAERRGAKVPLHPCPHRLHYDAHTCERVSCLAMHVHTLTLQTHGTNSMLRAAQCSTCC